MAKFVVLIEMVLLVYCLIDCIQTDASAVRGLSKPTWLVLIVLIPLVGGLGWLYAGRPERAEASERRWPIAGARRPPGGGRSSAPRGPDDDPDFLRQIREVDEEHERTLKRWEQDLADRERRLRDGDEPPEGPPVAPR